MIQTSSCLHPTWYKEISLPRNRYTYPFYGKTQDEIELVHERFIETTSKACLRQTKEKSLPRFFDTSRFANLSIEGIAVLATYLKHKKSLPNLYVCKTREALSFHLQQLSKSPEDCKMAFIVPTCNYDPLSTEDPPILFPYEQVETQHIVTIGIEKIGMQMHVVFFEPLGLAASVLQPDIILAQIEELKDKNVDFDNALFWYVMHSELPKDTAIYITKTKRQHAGNGCETFALRDAALFLLCQDFFVISGTKHLRVQSAISGKEMQVKELVSLPPEFMKSTQSMQAIWDYMNENPYLASRPYTYRKGSQILREAVGKHSVSIAPTSRSTIPLPLLPTQGISFSVEKSDQTGTVLPITNKEIQVTQEKGQPSFNDYNNERSRKYKALLVRVSEIFSLTIIQQILSCSLLSAPARSDSTIRTLNDLRLLQPEIIRKIQSRL